MTLVKPEIKLSPAMEDYLETIFKVQQHRKAVRVKDIAKLKGVSLPSVNSALITLVRKKLVIHDKYDYVELSELGEAIAQRIDQKHKILRKFFVEFLGLDEDTAEKDSCKMEHGLSSETLNRLVSFMDYVQTGSCTQGIINGQLECFQANFKKQNRKKKKSAKIQSANR